MKIQLLLFACLLSLGLSAQEKPIAVNVSVFNEATAIPFTRFFTAPVHPGIQLGTEFNLKSKKCSQLFQSKLLNSKIACLAVRHFIPCSETKLFKVQDQSLQ